MTKSLPFLLADDDLVDVKTVKRAFKHYDLANPLYVVSNGAEALAFLRHAPPYGNAAAAPRPGLILLDLNMPVMNGLEFLKLMKADEDLKSIPVIVLTSSKEESDLVASYQLSVAGYIVKPVDFAKFLDVVKVVDAYWSLCERL
jgi:CheY-like chemotaxis protein